MADVRLPFKEYAKLSLRLPLAAAAPSPRPVGDTREAFTAAVSAASAGELQAAGPWCYLAWG